MTTATETSPDMQAVLGDETQCAERVAPMWREADVLPHYPATSETVAEVLRAWGLDVNRELLDGWARSSMVPDVRIRSGRFEWSPRNMLTAAIQADTWRRWIPLSPRHIHKLTAVELEEARANAAGTTAFTDLEMFDACAFIEIMARCDDPNMRGTFAVALKTKLRNLGVLDK